MVYGRMVVRFICLLAGLFLSGCFWPEGYGGEDQPCFGNETCDPGLLCSNGLCVKGGGEGQPCFEDGKCNPGLVCAIDVCKPRGSVTDGDVPTDGDDSDDDGPTDGDIPCVCTTGPCCDGCHYRDGEYVCQTQVPGTAEYRCTADECGGDLEVMYQNRHCSGTASTCSGSVRDGTWTLERECNDAQMCNLGAVSCITNRPLCDPTYCAFDSGPCCNNATSTLRAEGYVCAADVDTEYGCPDGSGCNSNVGLRRKDRTCTGTNAFCNGQEVWRDWEVFHDCETNQRCHPEDFYCEAYSFHDEARCFESDRYWYNACDVREERLEVCDDGKPCTDNACEAGECVFSNNDENPCSLLTCTADYCEDGECQQGSVTTGCLIEGVCVEEGESHDDDGCVICDPEASRTAWSNGDGVACAVTDDGKPCTDNVCAGGVCTHPNNTASCDYGHSCVAGRCADGGCTFESVTVGCFIGNACRPEDARKSATGNDSCQGCVHASDSQGWTTLISGSCNDGNVCTLNDTCGAGGVCAGTQNPCSGYGTCNPVAGKCECSKPNMNQDCSACARGFANYPDCDECASDYSGYPDCQPNACNPDPCHGHGTCDPSDGSCDCENLNMNANCSACAPSFANYPACDECAEGFANYPACATEGFVPITAGSFWMGSPEGCPGPEGYTGSCQEELGRISDENLHYVQLTHNFEMAAFETTQGEWQTAFTTYPSYGSPEANRPVERVNWFEALAYANWLSGQKGMAPCYVLSGCTGTLGGGCWVDLQVCSSGTYSCTVSLNGVSKPQDCEGYRLPTEAEWEYAIRAGNQYTAFYRSPGNDGTITQPGYGYDPNLDLIGWYTYNSGGRTRPVGQKAANAWGLYDMSGNVFEWVWDWYAETYPSSTVSNPLVDPTGPASGSKRVPRGGAWNRLVLACRSATRAYAEEPRYRASFMGFRLARSLSPSSCTGDICGPTGVCVGKIACPDHSICDPQDGSCVCESPNMNDDCSTCAVGFTNYPDCDTCAPAFANYPFCDECAPGVIHYPHCNECAPGLENYPNCQPPLDCADGVCTDPSTSFEWQLAPTGGQMERCDANTHCQNLNLKGTGWRLPNISELRSLIRNCGPIETGGACEVTDVCTPCGDATACLTLSCLTEADCYPSSCTNDGGVTGCYWPSQLSGTCSNYWSSSSIEDSPGNVWHVAFANGDVNGTSQANPYVYVRCVRE